MAEKRQRAGYSILFSFYSKTDLGRTLCVCVGRISATGIFKAPKEYNVQRYRLAYAAAAAETYIEAHRSVVWVSWATGLLLGPDVYLKIFVISPGLIELCMGFLVGL